MAPGISNGTTSLPVHTPAPPAEKAASPSLPEPAVARLTKAGVDLSQGYPHKPQKPTYLDEVYPVRDYDRPYVDPASRADKSKKHLFAAAKEVRDLTVHIGTEVVGLQLKDLTDEQKDELALLIAERSVVFFRDQDISPQQQRSLGEWLGEIEVHVSISIYSTCTTPPLLIVSSANANVPPLAPSTPSPRCFRRLRDLARLQRRLATAQLPLRPLHRRLARRPRPRAPAGGLHAPAQ